MKRLHYALGSAILVTGLVVGGITFGQIKASDKPPLVQEVEYQGEVLDNHEDRITNNEADISDLQTNTNTPQSSERVVVREVLTTPPAGPIYTPPEPAPAPEPAPIVVASYAQIETDEGYNGENVDCKLTYSDGTTYQWHWKKVIYNQQKQTSTNGVCDSSVIGQEKS